MAAIPKTELISQREYARRRGISHTAVQQAITSGRISTVAGKIDPTTADRQWLQNTDQSKPRNRISGQPRYRRAPGAPPRPMRFFSAAETEGHDETALGYARARAARGLYLAQLAKLELDAKRSALVRSDEVRLAAFNMAREARALLLSLPQRVAAVVAAAADPAEVQRVLDEEIEAICAEMAGSR